MPHIKSRGQTMHALVNIAVKAARVAGNTLARAIDRLDRVEVQEKALNDYVTNYDIGAERQIIEIISEAYPHHSFLSEEAGHIGESVHQWIIDPIDGTANFMRGLPHFCISIAHAYEGKVDHGVIYDPMRQELFTASNGAGAFCNDQRLRVSKRSTLDAAIIATGFPYQVSEEDAETYAKLTHALLTNVSDIRRAGSAALDLAYVAAGRLDGYFERDVKIWDIAAGALMVKEAGGFISDLSGGENHLSTGGIVVAPAKIFKPLVQTISPLIPAEWKNS
jgi:myo-inositol-1(or 4)-monophosphatase